MKTKLSLFFCLSLVLMIISPQYVYGQDPGGQICSVCRKSNRDCSYKGNHPTCQTCGKVIGAKKNKCPHNGKHPEPQPTTGTLSITSTPSDAVVKIDGEYMGTTPLTLKNRKAGTYRITLSAEGYETLTKSVTVTAGKTATCSITLKKKQVQQPVQQPTTTATTTSSSQTITANGVSFKMILVEGGTFQMGGFLAEPVYQVTVSSFSIGATEVTQELWQAVMGSNPSEFKGSKRPVEQVSWNDCQTFITKLNQLTGKKFRLPTEAEWEFAARGGNKSKGYTYSGGNWIWDVGWYDVNSYDKGKSSPDYGTHNVATKSPNELGIYDMSGNVWEWCQDWYGSDYYSSSLANNPTGPSSGSYRVIRGGSWLNFAGYCRIANRGSSSPTGTGNGIGLRLVL